MKTRNPGINIAEVGVSDLTQKGFIAAIKQLKSTGNRAQIVTLNPEFIVEASKNSAFKNVINNADYLTIDGIGLVIMVRLMFGKKLTRLTGVDLIHLAAEYCEKEKGRIFLLGAGEGVAEASGMALKGQYPGIFVETDGSDPDDPNVVRHINKVKPDFLFVAYGAPKQDLWIAENLKDLNVTIACGVGGSLDYISGEVTRAPKFLRMVGLEWLFRLILQPKRLKRIFNAVVVFPYLAIRTGKRL